MYLLQLKSAADHKKRVPVFTVCNKNELNVEVNVAFVQQMLFVY